MDDRAASMAETWRRIGFLAARLDLPCPSYDTIRLLVRAHRERHEDIRELLEPVLGDLLQGRVSAWDVARVIEAASVHRRAGERLA